MEASKTNQTRWESTTPQHTQTYTAVGACKCLEAIYNNGTTRDVYSDSMPSKQNVQVQLINHQRLRSRVQMATKLQTAPSHRQHGYWACGAHVPHVIATSVYTKMACSTEPSVKYFTKFLNTSDMHSASGCASQTLRKPRSRVSANSSNIWLEKEGVFLLWVLWLHVWGRGCRVFTILYMQASESCVHQSSPWPVIVAANSLLYLPAPPTKSHVSHGTAQLCTCLLQFVRHLKGHTATYRLKIMVSSVWRKVRWVSIYRRGVEGGVQFM